MIKQLNPHQTIFNGDYYNNNLMLWEWMEREMRRERRNVNEACKVKVDSISSSSS